MSYRLFAATWAAALLLFTTHTTSAGAVSLKRLNVDLAVLVAKVASRKDQFAVPIRESFSTSSAGAWTIEGTEAVWRHSVSVPSAVTMSFYADHVRLPAAARLLVTNAAGKAFTYRQEHWRSSELWSFLHAGESLAFELRVPASSKSSVIFSISELQAGYRNLLGGPDHPAYRLANFAKASGPGTVCDINYECKRTASNSGSGQSVLGITFGNVNFCSATLVNNISGNLRPFILTAGHCNRELAEPSRSAYTFYWNSSTSCGGDLEFATDNADAVSSGGIERLRTQETLLIEANSAPPLGARPYWAGIDATDPQTGTSDGYARYDLPMYGIHHAQALARQWVESSSAKKIDEFPAGGDVFYDALDLDIGPIATSGRVLGGASGSPLFSADHRMLGILSGSNFGYECVTSDTGGISYQRIGPVWSALKPWLDPGNTGALQFSGKNDPSRGAAPVVTASISPNPTTSPATGTLTWSATNAMVCSIGGGTIAESNVPASGTRSLASSGRAAGDYTVTVACSSEEGTTGSKSVTWQILVPVGLTMDLSPPSVNTSQTSTLNWNAPGATACTASGEWSGSKAASGSVTVGPYSSAGTKTFGLQCTNAKGSQDATATLTVSSAPVPAPTVSLSAFPSSVSTGSGSSLSWSSTNATSCTASGAWSGSKATSGSESTGALAAGSYTYNLSCTGAGGTASQSTTVTASTSPPPPPPPTGSVDLTLTPGSVVVGNSATLTWSATDVMSCSASGAWSGSRALSGSESTGVKSSEGTYTYTLSCLTSALTSVTKSVTLTVQPMGAPTLSMQISPSSLTTGNAATISWVSSNATSCNAAGGFWNGVKSLSGSESTGILSTAGTRSYTLVCSNTSGDVIQQTVAVTATAPPTNPQDEVVVEGEEGGGSLDFLLLVPLAGLASKRLLGKGNDSFRA